MPNPRNVHHNQPSKTQTNMKSPNHTRPHYTNHQRKDTDKTNQEHLGQEEFETIILCDSNGCHINTKLICPNSTTKYIRCPTLTDAKLILSNTNLSRTTPKIFYIPLWNK